MNVFKPRKDYGHILVYFFISIMPMKETLFINSQIKHLVSEGETMDVVKVGLIFPRNAPTSLAVTVVVLVTLVSFVEGFSTSNSPIIMLGSSKLSKISSSKLIALCLAWCKPKVALILLLELGFVFVGGT